MKRTILALAVLGAFANAAHAQSSLTVYGSVDAGLRSLTNTNAAGDSTLTMNSSGTYRTNRLGFKGVEDLGGGMNAHFKLESGFNSGTGALVGDLFARTAMVGIGGDWGTLDLGRQYSVTFITNAGFEPFFNSYWTGISLAVPQGGVVRLNNDIQYTRKFGPATIRAEYAVGEVAGSTRAGSTMALGADYVAGAFNVGASYMTRKNAANTAEQKNWSAGGAYSSGPLRIAVGYAKDDRDPGFLTASALKIKDVWIGGTYQIAPAAMLGAALYRNTTDTAGVEGHKNLLMINGTYALSKRTNFYAEVDFSRYGGTYNNPAFRQPAGQDRQRGISAGIAHVF
ncbi:porin [Noviherbaspirillum sp.]|uniref:porin n=1 Tax=Noviherbaspirillum sp. TaxID=1926288 RepID=UPI002B4647BE|nr:porin [Noviherbaspirillum sp.]HJV82036.1 porin [Noviherbaspirillum sp.]